MRGSVGSDKKQSRKGFHIYYLFLFFPPLGRIYPAAGIFVLFPIFDYTKKPLPVFLTFMFPDAIDC